MVVYIEYAFFINFLLDWLLLRLALLAARRPVRVLRLTCAALVGAIGAILFPLFSVSNAWWLGFKLGGGVLLVALANGIRGLGKACLGFFGCSFALAGGMFALLSFQVQTGKFVLSQAGFAFILCAALGFWAVAGRLMKKWQARRAFLRHLYPCVVRIGNKSTQAQGFLDSGNFAYHKGRATCFLSPELAYPFLDTFADIGRGQVRDELQITTLTGVKKMPVFQGVLQVQTGEKIIEKQVYFAVSANMLSREYKLLLHSRILDD